MTYRMKFSDQMTGDGLRSFLKHFFVYFIESIPPDDDYDIDYVDFIGDIMWMIDYRIVTYFIRRFPNEARRFVISELHWIRNFAIIDVLDNPEDDWKTRRDRWVNTMYDESNYSAYRKNRKTGEYKPNPIAATFALLKNEEKIEELLKEGMGDLPSKLSEMFPFLSADDVELFCNDIYATKSSDHTALCVTANAYGMAPTTFKRHYIDGTLRKFMALPPKAQAWIFEAIEDLEEMRFIDD